MPFWWQRRRKNWYGRNISYRYPKYKRRRRRRFTRRRRWRRTAPYRRRRRRRRRRRKVRRKKQTIPVRQWQPDSIVKCKIIGNTALIIGAQGRQMNCYTNIKDKTVPPKTPYGGGFAYEVYSLKWLYSEYKFHQNVWTASNILKDLCRYLHVKFTVYRHPDTDFVIQFDRQPPFFINKFSYMGCHPQQLLLQKNKIILLSKQSKPHGKIKKTFIVKPPKQMISKWFFTDSFYKQPLLALRAAAMDFRYSYLGCCNENMQLNVPYLSQKFYSNAGWGIATGPYLPYSGIPTTFNVAKPKQTTFTFDPRSGSGTQAEKYAKSIDYTEGYFSPRFLTVTQWGGTSASAVLPVNYCIYNPNLDSGEQNQIYLSSIHSTSYDQPTKDPSILIQGVPLWLGIWGFLQYINEIKQAKDFLDTHVLLMKSPALIPHPDPGWTTGIIPLDFSFINGNSFFNQPPNYHEKKYWYPTVSKQLGILNAFATVGPFVPKRDNQTNSTWELKLNYKFYFKWGGPQVTDKEVQNPADLGHYDVPDKIPGTIQIKNPAKQTPESFIQAWDYRRGFIKESALKRVYENQSTDTSFQAATEEPPLKKRCLPILPALQNKNKKIKTCLLSLCEEDTSKEAQTEDLQQLILQQKHQQQQLKYNILQLLADFKKQQRMLQLQTGLME
nr:MAG: ORF1 [Torque teno midi virus]